MPFFVEIFVKAIHVPGENYFIKKAKKDRSGAYGKVEYWIGELV